ncbi:MAG TPA: tyrosine-type recombinase/integrase [Kiritimatiellia bacterium]|nr:tyrosine-type recombinase/integrase [Kiritimatiellia bacterium]HRU70621.1 tyrosine-type recombinase/integrase [Kiritimatiellia bacterium]
MALFKFRNSNNWWYSIYRPGLPRLQGTTGTPDKETAKLVEMSIRAAHQKNSSADKLHAMIDMLLGNTSTDGLPLAGLWPEYERSVKTSGKQISALMMSHRRQWCGNFVKWASEHHTATKTIEDVDRACASAYAIFLASRGTKSKTRANILSGLATIWTSLQRVRDGITNPWKLVIPSVTDGERGKAFSHEQELAVMESAKQVGDNWWIVCMIARPTGLRFGDIANLSWDKINMNDRIIEIAPSKTARYGIAVRIPISNALYGALESADIKCGLLFPDMSQKQRSGHSNRGTPFGLVLKAAGLDDKGYTFHSWRHTLRTRLAEAGVSDEIAKRLGGWTDDNTARRYDHDGRMNDLREAVERASRA